MYWKETPVRGVEDAELPQFSILGHETNDRKVRKLRSNTLFHCQKEHTHLVIYFVFRFITTKVLMNFNLKLSTCKIGISSLDFNTFPSGIAYPI